MEYKKNPNSLIVWALIFATTINSFCFFFVSLTSLFSSAIVGDGTIEERGLEGSGTIYPGDEDIGEEPFFRDRQMITVKHVYVGVHEYMGVSIFNFQGFVIYHKKCENKTPSKITNPMVRLIPALK